MQRGVDILQCIYCRGYNAVQRGGGGGEGVEQDLCKPLAATNFCSADSQPLPCMRISIARRCTNYKDVQRCTKMYKDVHMGPDQNWQPCPHLLCASSVRLYR